MFPVSRREIRVNGLKLATRNLPADAIDKVQVYDRLSDQSQLTGFEDGNSEKTINLRLKKDKKKGYFGKAMAGAGTDQRYEGRFNVNSFKDARQLSVIGMGNNTNAEGFSFMDLLNFNPDAANMNQGGGNINININSGGQGSGQMGGNNNTGINTTWAGGVNYNNLIGTIKSVNNRAKIIPPIMTTPNGTRLADAAPNDSAKGKAPSAIARLVISIGLIRWVAASNMATFFSIPSILFLLAKSTIKMPFFVTKPISIIIPIWEKRFSYFPHRQNQ